MEDYLARLGLEREEPSVEGLFRLHRAHVERVPYETLWIHLDERRGIDQETSARLVAGGRGGYCYHLNGAFGWLLAQLGYRVTRHVGGVHGPGGPDADSFTNHLALTVDGLSDESWYVDTGLGDALHEPVPLRAGTYRQGPIEFRLEVLDGSGDWHLVHDPKGSFPGMAWHPGPTAMDAFAERHATLSTAPDSGFVKVMVLQRRDADSLDSLRDLTLTHVASDGPSATTIETETDWHAAFGDVFGIDVRSLPTERLASLWPNRVAAHEAWLATRAATASDG
ncbi:arylamine N-acetyltransferase [Intrasporangium mesophilum]